MICLPFPAYKTANVAQYVSVANSGHCNRTSWRMNCCHLRNDWWTRIGDWDKVGIFSHCLCRRKSMFRCPTKSSLYQWRTIVPLSQLCAVSTALPTFRLGSPTRTVVVQSIQHLLAYTIMWIGQVPIWAYRQYRHSPRFLLPLSVLLNAMLQCLTFANRLAY